MKTALQLQLIQNLRKMMRGFASARNVFVTSPHYTTPLHTFSMHVPSSHYYPATPHYCIRGPAPTVAS